MGTENLVHLNESREAVLGERVGLLESESSGLEVLVNSKRISTWCNSPGKRIFDAVASGALLLSLSPLMLVIAILVRLTSRGPVFFRQERVGLRGHQFKIVK